MGPLVVPCLHCLFLFWVVALFPQGVMVFLGLSLALFLVDIGKHMGKVWGTIIRPPDLWLIYASMHPSIAIQFVCVVISVLVVRGPSL